MRFAAPTAKSGIAKGANRIPTPAHAGCSAFTLAEVLAAMLFMAIVVPVVVDSMRIASLSGEVAARKGEAALVADKVLNESIVTTNWNQGGMRGTEIEAGHEYRWTMKTSTWQGDSSMSMLSVEVNYFAGGREFSVTMNTLANSPNTSSSSSGSMTAR